MKLTGLIHWSWWLVASPVLIWYATGTIAVLMFWFQIVDNNLKLHEENKE